MPRHVPKPKKKPSRRVLSGVGRTVGGGASKARKAVRGNADAMFRDLTRKKKKKR